jgi:hypothetical protein
MRLASVFLSLIFCLGMFISSPATSRAEVVVLGETDWVSGDSRLTLDMPSVTHAGLIVSSNSAGDYQWISMTIPFAWGKKITGIYLCYKTPNQGTYISQIRLAEYTVPGTAGVAYDDPTDLFDPDGACYFSSVGNYTPGGSVDLSLRLNFANAEDEIWLGALAIFMQ